MADEFGSALLSPPNRYAGFGQDSTTLRTILDFESLRYSIIVR